tara:strand:+ start:269 stop:418 length:150 start_codon:yes stop_codon:yes gene_type:complete
MSFETTAVFLKMAALNGDPDNLFAPSARLIMGQLVKQGTGAFDLQTMLE